MSFILDRGLLSSRSATKQDDGNFNAVLNANGTYNTFQFVLRLSPRVHRLLSSREPGIYTSGEVGFDHAQAFSTLLHETVHWWQHVGSTYGLMLSLTFPAQAHNNYGHLKRLVREVGFKKNIRTLAARMRGPKGLGTIRGVANIVINNHFDFGAFRGLTIDSESLKATVEHPLFQSIGHTFELTYGNSLALLGGTTDPAHTTLPDPRRWNGFEPLRKKKEEGFYYGSPVNIWPVGAREIFEGQACIAQLQYLAFASGGNLSWQHFRDEGMLYGVYETAFRHFLDQTHLPWPPSVIHPTTALFLLVCDMALNPGSGFPFEVRPHYASFITDVDPGARFSMLCTMARLRCPEVLNAIHQYSREEYKNVSETLARVALIHSPLAIAEECTRWTTTEAIGSLMAEYETFDYGRVNLPIRVLFSHFLAFMRDKHARPEYFCWPGAWMAGDRVSEATQTLFERHQALFCDKEDDDGVFPRIQKGRDEKFVNDMFDSFYAMNVTYDLADQWIAKPGPFTYDLAWLSSSGSVDDMKGFADRHFKMVFGVHPDEVELLPEEAGGD